MAVGSLRWPWKRAEHKPEQLRAQAGTGMGADSLEREPHMVSEQVESLGADVRARTEFGRGCEVHAQTGRRGWWAQTAERTLEAQH
jgi:hypothetical protein